MEGNIRVLVTLAIALAAMMAWTQATAVDVHILGFRFNCATPDGEVRKPKFGDIGGIFFTNLPKERKPCLETIDRMIYSCTANTTFISHELNRKYASCLPVFERQSQECAAHFESERAKCNAGSDNVKREAHTYDTRSVEDDAKNTGEDGSSAGDVWKPWEDEAASDAWKPWEDEAASDTNDDENWVDIADSNEGIKPDDSVDGECKNVWAECPVDTDWTKKRQEGARQIELAGNSGGPQASAAINPDDEKWGYEEYGVNGKNNDAADSSRHGYEKALAGILNEDGSSAAHLDSAPDEDYLAVLEKMDAGANEKAATDAAAQQEHQETEGDDSCGSAPASRNYLSHDAEVFSQLLDIAPTGVTDDIDSALFYAFSERSRLGCMRKILPYETDACKTTIQSLIAELEDSYQIHIGYAKTLAVGSSYVDEFDRDPGSSQFVRKFGIHISGANLDSCGD